MLLARGSCRPYSAAASRADKDLEPTAQEASRSKGCPSSERPAAGGGRAPAVKLVLQCRAGGMTSRSSLLLFDEGRSARRRCSCLQSGKDPALRQDASFFTDRLPGGGS